MPERSGHGQGQQNGISLHPAPAHVALLPLVLASLLPTLAVTLSRNQAIIASIVVILIVIIAWKFLKLAFKIALVVVAAVLIFMALQWANIL